MFFFNWNWPLLRSTSHSKGEFKGVKITPTKKAGRVSILGGDLPPEQGWNTVVWRRRAEAARDGDTGRDCPGTAAARPSGREQSEIQKLYGRNTTDSWTTVYTTLYLVGKSQKCISRKEQIDWFLENCLYYRVIGSKRSAGTNWLILWRLSPLPCRPPSAVAACAGRAAPSPLLEPEDGQRFIDRVNDCSSVAHPASVLLLHVQQILLVKILPSKKYTHKYYSFYRVNIFTGVQSTKSAKSFYQHKFLISSQEILCFENLGGTSKMFHPGSNNTRFLVLEVQKGFMSKYWLL